MRNSTVSEDYFDRSFTFLRGRELPSNSSRSVLCVIRDGIPTYFGSILRFAWYCLSQVEPPGAGRHRTELQWPVIHFAPCKARLMDITCTCILLYTISQSVGVINVQCIIIIVTWNTYLHWVQFIFGRVGSRLRSPRWLDVLWFTLS